MIRYRDLFKFTSIVLVLKISDSSKKKCDRENNFTYLLPSTLDSLKYSQYQGMNNEDGTNISL